MTRAHAEPDECTEVDGQRGLLLSVQPRHAAAILAGTKTVELRRKAPREVDGATIVLYASGAVRAVVGTVQVIGIVGGSPDAIWVQFSQHIGITRPEFDVYFTGTDEAYALVLMNPTVAPSPMPLPDLRQHDLEPPQSWRYLTKTIIRTLRLALGFADGSLATTGPPAPAAKPR